MELAPRRASWALMMKINCTALKDNSDELQFYRMEWLAERQDKKRFLPNRGHGPCERMITPRPGKKEIRVYVLTGD